MIKNIIYQISQDDKTQKEINALLDKYAKETLKHLYRCKTARLELLEYLGGSWDAAQAPNGQALTPDQESLRQATLTTRDTERQAFDLWQDKKASDSDKPKHLGELMAQHQSALRNGLGLSTARLDEMGRMAIESGAWGFKLVGSGGGGCGVAWTSLERSGAVVDALRAAGATQVFVMNQGARGAHIRRS